MQVSLEIIGMRCQTCQHWKAHETVSHGTRGECTAAESIGFHTDHFSQDKAAVPRAFDRHGLPVSPPLLTGPTYGCILHRQR